MPSNRFDDDAPRIILDKEDKESFRQSRSKGKYTASTEPDVEASESTANAASGGMSPVWTSLLLILILGGLGASYWLYQQQAKLTQTLTSAQERILELENQLSATGAEMGESAVVIQARVNQLDAKSKELWDQMDKLWASAWRRNQSDIKDVVTKLDTLTNGNSDVGKQIKSLQTEINASMTNFDLLQEQFNKHSQSIANLTSANSASAQSQKSQTKKLAELNRKLIAADKISSALLKRINDLEKWQKSQAAAKKAPTIEQQPKKKVIPPPITVG